jgi:hypothetical protein
MKPQITATRICKPPSRWVSNACSIVENEVSAMAAIPVPVAAVLFLVRAGGAAPSDPIT